jgi:hypothetical protein
MNARQTVVVAFFSVVTALAPIAAVTTAATGVVALSATNAEAKYKPPYGWRGCVIKDGKVLNKAERLYCATKESPAVKRKPSTSPRVARR